MDKIKKFISDWISKVNKPIFLEQRSEMIVSQQNGVRDETFDILKGLAIILMIIGHCNFEALHQFIDSFHMPLFFFVAGYFLKKRPISIEIRLSFKRLVVPYIFTAFIICSIALCNDLSNYTWADGSFTQGTIISHLFGFRGEVRPIWLTGNIGVLWFILAMFWARCFVTLLLDKIRSEKMTCFIILFCGLLGIFLEENFFIPYCIPQGLSATGFVYVGYLVKKYNFLKSATLKKFFPMLLVLWLWTWSQGGVWMASNRFFTGYVFSLLGSLGAFVTLYSFVNSLFYKNSLIWKIIQFMGRYSLIIYSIHAAEGFFFNWTQIAVLHHIPLDLSVYFIFLTRLIIALVFTFIILKIKPLRENIFQIRPA